MVATAGKTPKKTTKKLEETEPTRRKQQSAYKAAWAVFHVLALVWVWKEALWLAALALKAGMSLFWIATLIVFMTMKGMKDEMAKNIRDTFRHRLVFAWQCRQANDWELPKIEKVELGGYVGHRKALTMFARYRSRAVPYQSMTIHWRRPDSKGDDQVLAQNVEFVKRYFRFQRAEDPTQDPQDSNVDIVVLRSAVIPDLLRAA